jgi:hypothetical protein
MTIFGGEEDLVPLCERCWIEENSVWEPDSVDEKGNIITKLVSVNVPIQLSPGAVNECFTCGRVTVVGIYVPIDEIEEYQDDYDQSS